MADGITLESGKDRFKRYEASMSNKKLSDDIIEDAYLYCLPMRNTFDISKGEERTDQIFDTTAVTSLNSFASNIQSILVPPGKNWAQLVPGDNVPKELRKDIIEQLQTITDTLFSFLNQSNFNMMVNESLQDMAISTGIMTLNEGTKEKPFQFRSIAYDDVTFDEGPEGNLENFWFKWNLPIRRVMRKWPEATLPTSFQQKLQDNPDAEIELIEGTIFYPDNPPGKQYYYYVQTTTEQNDIFSEWMEYSPWIGFRFGRITGEVIGSGPALLVLNDIKSLNVTVEMDLKALQFNAYPAYTAPNTGMIDPFNLVLQPGGIIPVDPQFAGQQPIRALEGAGNPQVGQVKIENLQQVIRDAFFSQPLGPQGTQQTATEASIRQQQWARESNASFSRIYNEFAQPIISKCLRILRRFELIEPIVINGKKIDDVDGLNLGVQFRSPLAGLEDQDQLQRFQQYVQMIGQELGPGAAMATLHIGQVPGWIAEKLDVDMDLIKSPADILTGLKDAQEAAAQQAQNQAVQSGQQPPPTPQPPQNPAEANVAVPPN